MKKIFDMYHLNIYEKMAYLVISENIECSYVDICEKAGMSRVQAIRSVKKLIEKKLIEKEIVAGKSNKYRLLI